MASLGDLMGRQVGPLPMGAWVAVVGGGLGIGVWVRRRQAADVTLTPADPQSAAVDQTATDQYGGVPAYQPGPYVPPPYTTTSDPYAQAAPPPSSPPPLDPYSPLPALVEVTNWPDPLTQPPPSAPPDLTPPAPRPPVKVPKTYLPNVISSYTTRRGQTITQIAGLPGIRGTFPGGPSGLYSANQTVILAATRRAGWKATPTVSTPLPAGIVLRIP